jgi:2-keto-4-pentenoate hydratase/2-oxohepta-3-ene-1,7-dioic acid hydratase in catechol pathway
MQGAVFEATAAMDFELEVGFFVGPGTELGVPLTVAQARDHIFGCVLLNDWSARDIQVNAASVTNACVYWQLHDTSLRLQ